MTVVSNMTTAPTSDLHTSAFKDLKLGLGAACAE